MKKVFSMMLCALILCLCLVGCGGSDIEGKWECCKVVEGGKTYEGDFMGIPLGVVFQFEFKSDGKGTVTSFTGGSDKAKMDFEWEKDGDKVKMTVNENGKDDTSEFEYKDGKLEGDMGSIILTAKKVDKFTEFDIEEFKKKLTEN